MVSLLYRDHELTGVFNFDKVGGIGHATAFNLGGGGEILVKVCRLIL